jgi:DnaK suppressor protein
MAPAPREEEPMRKAQISRYRTLLERQLAELVGHGAATVHGMAREGDEIPDPNDRATREADRNQELRMRDRDRKLIAKIQEALARIEEGTFGRCAACGAAIDAARLRARPVTTLCIDCKREAEAVER